METLINYVISKESGESLVICQEKHVKDDVNFYRNERGYALKVEKVEFCAVCNGTNKVPVMRGKKQVLYSYKPCGNCKGVKIQDIDVTHLY